MFNIPDGTIADDVRAEFILKRLTLACIAITTGISGIAIVGWILNRLLIARISPGYIPMAPSTAVSFIILGFALFVHVRKLENPQAMTFAKIGAFLVLLVCFIILIDFFTGSGLDIEKLLYLEPEKLGGVPIGRMSPITAANFLMAGSALLLMLKSPTGEPRAKGAAAYLAAIVTLVGFVMLLGYLYGTPLLYGGTIIPVALPTAIALVFLGAGLIGASGSRFQPLSFFMGSATHARLLRAFLPLVIAIILLEGWLIYVIHRQPDINPALVSSLTAILFAIIFSSVVNHTAQSIGSSIDRANTERRMAEGKLRESEEKYRNLVERSNDSVLIIQDGLIKFTNVRLTELWGSNAEELLETPIVHHIHPDERDKVMERYRRRMANEYVPPIYETVLLRKDGTAVHVEINAGIISYKGKAADLVVIRDITERKKAEEIRLENLRLEAADRAKSDFLSNMSHELRTPLNSIIGFSELMKQGMAGKLNEKQEHYTDNIFTSGTFLLSLINDILDLSKIEAGKIELAPEKISVPVTIGETLNLLKEKAARHKILLKAELDPELEFIEADKQRFKQILFNLLSNAVKFSKEEGGIVTITAKKEDHTARISISDTGIGIKEKNMGRLFYKFEQLEPEISQKYGGTGLGLSITKHLVELHGGTIRAESRYGEGSTFTFTLPLKAVKTA